MSTSSDSEDEYTQNDSVSESESQEEDEDNRYVEGSDDPEEFVRESIHSLVNWKSPMHSALWFSVLGLIFFLTQMSEYTLVTLVSYLILLQLMATTAAIRTAP